jgi:hypothetical protein
MPEAKMMMNPCKLQNNKDAKNKTPAARREIPENRNEDAILPPSIVETVISSSQSLTTSIGIGKFGNLSCGWSKQGLETFNQQVAREILISHNGNGEDFDKAFKKHIEQEMASTKKSGKSEEEKLY